MTTATEHHDAQLAAIKARHEQVRAMFADPAVTIIEDGIADFPMIHQVGLMSVYVDPTGRFWTVTVGGEPQRITARMVFDPSATKADMQEIMRINNVLRDIALAAREHVPATLLTKINENVAPDPDDLQAAQGFKAHEG